VSTELSRLFDKAAEEMSPGDIAEIVKAMRESRAQFELGLKAPVVPRPKAAKKTPEGGDLDLLKDLDLS